MAVFWCVIGKVVDGPNQVQPEFEGAKLVGPPEEARIAKVETANAGAKGIKECQTLCKKLFPSSGANTTVVVTEAEWKEI